MENAQTTQFKTFRYITVAELGTEYLYKIIIVYAMKPFPNPNLTLILWLWCNLPSVCSSYWSRSLCDVCVMEIASQYDASAIIQCNYTELRLYLTLSFWKVQMSLITEHSTFIDRTIPIYIGQKAGGNQWGIMILEVSSHYITVSKDKYQKY